VKVLAVVSEIFPLVKTGGLADVAGALPLALAPLGINVASLVPGYPAVMDALADAVVVRRYGDLFGGPARLLRGHAAGLEILAIDAPHLYARPGNPYIGPDGRDWPDNAIRFAALAAIAADVGAGAVADFAPDIVHAHDWQAGLTAAYLRHREIGGAHPGTVMTVHNLAFQGQFPAALVPTLGLPWSAYTPEGVEYYGAIGFLKAGVALSDRITTVSPSYAAEIRTSDGGMGMDGLLRARAPDVRGILNGIDDAVWDPTTDGLIARTFDPGHLAERRANKAALQARLGLAVQPDTLLFGVISRLTWQKGLDLLLAAMPDLLARGVQLALLGSGDAALVEGFVAAAAANVGRVSCVIGYDEGLAHLIQAGADAILVPSRFEPCGLTQLCALRYGALPVVARVGGLADTVIDANEMALASSVGTGLQFAPVTRDALVAAIQRTVELWREPETWRTVQRNAMRSDVSWRRPAAHYAALYREVLAGRAA
jgi:starch synthase